MNQTLLIFSIVAFVGIATPGPTVLLALTNGSRFGVRASLPGMAGAVLSDCVLISAVAVGLGGLLAASEIPARLIVNRISAALVKRGDMLSQSDVIEILALDMLGAIPLDDQVIATTNKGVPAVLEGKSIAAKMFMQIAMKLAGMEVDERQVGFFTRLGRALGLTTNPA